MSNPRIWADPMPLSPDEQRAELIAQVRRLPGVVAVQMEGDEIIRIALDPHQPEAIPLAELATQLRSMPNPPKTIQIAIPATEPLPDRTV